MTTIATAVEQHTAATRVIADSVVQASRGIQEVNEDINQSASVSTEHSSGIASVSVSMDEMSANSKLVNVRSHRRISEPFFTTKAVG